MVDKDKRIFEILKYLNEGHVRKNDQLSQDTLRPQFPFTANDFNDAFKEMEERGLIYKREGTDNIAISTDGETKYNELHLRFSDTNPKKSNGNSRATINYYALAGIVIPLVAELTILEQTEAISDLIRRKSNFKKQLIH